ncbi:hypothetical protein PG997_001073 [Apiospora hydei]|uniref:Uncharacterized protein n=1 Tax=Apiospora hydei TaxID=1337664 RepID=A0ABR1XCI8_9PEZI
MEQVSSNPRQKSEMVQGLREPSEAYDLTFFQRTILAGDSTQRADAMFVRLTVFKSLSYASQTGRGHGWATRISAQKAGLERRH